MLVDATTHSVILFYSIIASIASIVSEKKQTNILTLPNFCYKILDVHPTLEWYLQRTRALRIQRLMCGVMAPYSEAHKQGATTLLYKVLGLKLQQRFYLIITQIGFL